MCALFIHSLCTFLGSSFKAKSVILELEDVSVDMDFHCDLDASLLLLMWSSITVPSRS